MRPRDAILRTACTLVTVLVVLGSSLAGASRAAAVEERICDANADFALGSEDYPRAIMLHLKLVRAHAGDALAHYHLGFAYGMSGRPKDELDEYLAAVKLGLKTWDLFVNLGLAYLEENDSLNGTNALETAVLLGPSHPETHAALANAYEKEKRLRQALREISAALQLRPEDPDERNTKAIICSELKDLRCARDEWTHLVQVAPEYAPAQVNLAILDRLHPPTASSPARAPVRSSSTCAYSPSSYIAQPNHR